MNYRIITTIGLFIFILITAGCGSDSLKSSNFLTRPETEILEESAIEPTENPETELLEESTIEPTENPETNCSSLNPHPVAEGITDKFPINYDEVMTLYCDGFAFSDILLALETEQLVDQSYEDLLSLLETNSWEKIWDDLGVSPE